MELINVMKITTGEIIEMILTPGLKIEERIRDYINS